MVTFIIMRGSLAARGRTAVGPPSHLRQQSSVARRAFFTRTGLVHFEGLSVYLAAVEAGDRRTRFVVASVLDEAKTLRLTARALGRDLRRDRRSIGNGELIELRIGDLSGEISHVEFHSIAPWPFFVRPLPWCSRRNTRAPAESREA